MKALLMIIALITTSAINAEMTVSSLTWMTGSWSGTMGENSVEEIWTEPTGNSIQASVRIISNNATIVHEVVVINQSSEGISLYLQQWDSTFQPLNPAVTMQMVEQTENSISFAGGENAMFDRLTYRRSAEDQFEIAITVKGQPEFVIKMSPNE